MLAIILVIFCICLLGNSSGVNTPNYLSGKKSSHSFFEESDSVFDRHGNEHLVDDDCYCDDCDDYHDDWC